jgi:plastocyanin
MQSKIIYSKTGRKLMLYSVLSLACIYSNATTHTIQEGDYAFTPSNINAVVGDTIIWSWVSGSHTTTSTSVPGGANTWNSPMNSTNTSFQYVVTLPGTYNFHCNIHPTMMMGSITVSAATAIDEPATINDVSIYPNPTTGRVQVTAPWMIKDMEIFDVLGNSIYSVQINSDMIAVDLSGQANGIYFMRLHFDNRTAIGMRKIIVDNQLTRQ